MRLRTFNDVPVMRYQRIEFNIDGGFVATTLNNLRDRAILQTLLTLRGPLDVRFIA